MSSFGQCLFKSWLHHKRLESLSFKTIWSLEVAAVRSTTNQKRRHTYRTKYGRHTLDSRPACTCSTCMAAKARMLVRALQIFKLPNWCPRSSARQERRNEEKIRPKQHHLFRHRRLYFQGGALEIVTGRNRKHNYSSTFTTLSVQ